jgi:hypothetical protein
MTFTLLHQPFGQLLLAAGRAPGGVGKPPTRPAQDQRDAKYERPDARELSARPDLDILVQACFNIM